MLIVPDFICIYLCIYVYLILITCVPIMSYDINKEKFSTFLKRMGLSKRFSTAEKILNIGSFTISSVQTPSKL